MSELKVELPPEKAGPVEVAPPPSPLGLKIVPSPNEKIGTKADIAIECDTIHQAYSLEAREMVLTYAKQIGMSRPGFSGGCWIEWVGPDGNRLQGEEFKNAAVKRIRAHYPVQEGL
jgi:hypothetical protein